MCFTKTIRPPKRPNIFIELMRDFWTGIKLLFWIWPDPIFGGLNKITIPLMKRVYPQLIANKLVSVQPLLQPTGLVHYLNYRYATTSKTEQE